MLKAIIFDFDGVIGDTFKTNFELFKPFISNLTEQDFKDNHNGNIFQGSKINLAPDQWVTYFKQQKERFTTNNLFPLKGVLSELSKKFQLFIVSSTPDESLKYFLGLGDLNFFTQIFGATTHRSKHEKFKMLLEKYSLKHDECILITDTLGDILEAKTVDIKSIAVTWGYHQRELLEKGGSAAIVDDKDELLKQIEKINGDA